MSRFLPLTLLGCCVALSACVTINVYFPAAAAEKAADKIIDDVWGATGQGKPGSKSDKQSSSSEGERGTQILLAAASSLMNLIIPTATAQADLNIATPAVRQLTQSMEARHAALKKLYDAGSVGQTRDGLIEIRDQNLIPLPERNAARKLVADENADRASLYREIAAANGHPEWETDIRTTFAQRWADKASTGWFYQDSSGAWKQK